MFLLQHYGALKAAVTPKGDAFTKSPLISTDIHTEWKQAYYCSRQQVKKDTEVQLQKPTHHEMLATMLPIY